MKLLLDQGLPRSSASLLRSKGIEASHVGELGMADASDEAIIDYARKHSFAVATLDADFHALLAITNSPGPSVIRLRIQPLKAPEATSVLSRVLEQLGPEIERGSFITVTPTNIRVRRLPIRPS